MAQMFWSHHRNSLQGTETKVGSRLKHGCGSIGARLGQDVSTTSNSPVHDGNSEQDPFRAAPARICQPHSINIWGQKSACFGGCSEHCRMFISISGLYPQDDSNNPPPDMTIKNVSGHCQTAPRGVGSHWKSPSVEKSWWTPKASSSFYGTFQTLEANVLKNGCWKRVIFNRQSFHSNHPAWTFTPS